MIRILLFVLLVFQATHVAANDNPLTAFLDKLDSLQSSFTQTLINENGNSLEQTSGVLYLQPPDKFHWAYEQPYKQKIISDGVSLWIYDEDLEQVTIRSFGEAMQQTPAGIIMGNEDLNKHFLQIELGNIEGYDWIELTPRDTETQYKTIKIGFYQNNLGMMIIDDNLGQTTRIDFQEVSKNSDLDSELFSLTVPENVDVIDERELSVSPD